ncbi:MAG: 4-hydroxy-tetrahydrodipicolinate synthase [Bacteroidetes bacterium]|nr:4-hydroxy-tetrahydrodipicolinate synthase [Bacteroidota bacterium]
MKKFKGVGVALITPFKNDKSIDYVSLSKLVEHTIKGGVSFLVALGTTAESAVLTKQEKQDVLDFIVKKCASRVPIVVGIGGNNTIAVGEEMNSMNLKGIDAILSVVPFYNKPNQEGMYQHYKYLAEVSPLPIIMYNVPGRTGSNMCASTTVRLAKEFKKLIAVKEASGNMSQAGYILRDAPEDFTLLSGDDNLSLSIIANGGDGVISVSANAFPKKFSSLINNALNENYKVAQSIQKELLEVTDLLFKEGNPVGIKSALKSLDIVENNLRLPLVKSTKPLDIAIQEQIKKFNLE